MIIVHHLEKSRSHRVLWLLEELQLDYEVKRYQRDRKTMLAPKSLARVHPLGKSPVIEHDDIVVAETGAIFEYLLALAAPTDLRPRADSAAGRQFSFWLHYAEGSLMPPMLLRLVFSKLPQQPMPFFVRPVARAISAGAMQSFIDPQLHKHLAFVDAELQRQHWLAGNAFSAADVMLSFPLQACRARDLLSGYASISDWLQRCEARPAWQGVVARVGALDLDFS